MPWAPTVLTPFANAGNDAVDLGCNPDQSVYVWPAMHRTGNVALIGLTNVGKSTFLNTALGEPLAIVSSRPQTTRDTLLAIVYWKNAEIALIDSPGLHKPRNELGHRMNAAAMGCLRSADVVVLIVNAEQLVRRTKPQGCGTRADGPRIWQDTRHLTAAVAANTPLVVVANKIDKLTDKRLLLPLLAELNSWRPSIPVIPVSCLLRADVERVLDELEPLLPAGPNRFSSDALTDRPVRYFVAEYIREQVMRTTSGEIPFAVAVKLDEFAEYPSVTVIKATLCVEKDGQRVILIGRSGQQVRKIGMLARRRIEGLLKQKVHLELFIRTQKQWRDRRSDLDDLGYAKLRATGWAIAPTRAGQS